MGADYTPARKYWIDEVDLYLDQAGAVQNTWYTVLALTTGGVAIRSISPAITVANETVELEIFKDGNILTASAGLVVGNRYMVANRVYSAQPVCVAGADIQTGYLWQGHSLQVWIRKTTNLGAGNLQCRLKYQTLQPL